MLRNKKVVVVIVVVVIVAVGAGVGYAQRGGSPKKRDLVILDSVQRRTLQDTVTLTGTLARQERRKVTSVTSGRVSAVYVKDGANARAGEALFAVDGRDAIAEPGSVRFFRSLQIGDRGDDVLQLKQILAAAGDYPGPMDTVYTPQTQFALAQWQAAHHYPGATPVSPQSVEVSLAQGTGYTLGAQSSAGLILVGAARTSGASGASALGAGQAVAPAQTRAATFGATAGVVHHGVLTAFRSGGSLTPFAVPGMTIQSTNAVVSEGTPATFVITSSDPVSSNTDIQLSIGGTATSSDIVTPPTTVTMLANTSSVTVTVPTRVDDVVKPKKTLTIGLVPTADYTVSSLGSAQTTITNNNVPAVQISGGTTVDPGGSATLTVTAAQAPLHDTQVSLSFAGDAVPGTDYRTVDPVVVLPAGRTSASITVRTLTNHVIQPDRHIVVSVTPAPTQYSVASPGIAVITIAGATGDAALPLVTLTSAVTHLAKGQPFPVTLSLNAASTRPLTISLAYGGTAGLGTDFTLPGGNIVVPAGQTSLSVMVPTVQDKVVESDRVLVVQLAAAAGYRVGSPNTAAVTIQSSVTPELTITSDSTTVADGGSATFTITADQAPAKDTSVNYQVIGTAQPGQDFQPLLGTALLRAGQTTVRVALLSIRRDVVFEPTDMIVAGWPVRIGQVFVKEGDAAPPGTPILSITDPNFTVTLNASASDRTKLAVGQHCTVELVGGVTEVPGTISELDQNLTTLSAASPGAAQQQVYQGKIQVADLGAADGAAVTIKVIDQQATNVLTVPIAAVKQNGSGQSVVRVIDLAHGGRVTEKLVQTGLTEGSYVEVTKGLAADETVIVQDDQAK